MNHATPSPLAGKTVRIKKGKTHPKAPDLGGAEYRVEDWWDRVYGKPWAVSAGNPA